jgi:hypothetical protein
MVHKKKKDRYAEGLSHEEAKCTPEEIKAIVNKNNFNVTDKEQE